MYGKINHPVNQVHYSEQLNYATKTYFLNYYYRSIPLSRINFIFYNRLISL